MDEQLEEEYAKLASRYDAFYLKQLVDLGMILNFGAVKEKIESSTELQLGKAMDDAQLTEQQRLKLVGFLLLATNQKSSTNSPS
ncbi:hypothetical protein FD723_40725 (plasmid) [Nostoc sp. C052]|uniref:hypothetical protein n=1 Tax=Nostoc sp. C052 TaxID=2576902 RepID=UPI0015C3DA49|nr:hypothetical protein [Nostoc sp. C052]QLE46540.1 hypothetical protein FD723_40725 [Nostoc sp. C052]